MKTNTFIIPVIAVALMTGLLLAFAASGDLVSSTIVQNTGIVASANVGVYSDYSCTQSLTSINWGTISPGSVVTRTVFVKNTGIAPLTLSLTISNWSPASANGPITVYWDQEYTVLDPNHGVTATLTLSLSSNTNGITIFSFNVVISGTG